MTGKGKPRVGGTTDACLSYWNDREMQLVRLHEEILSRREAMLNCSMAYHQSQETRSRHEAGNVEQAYLRNHKLLKDIRTAQVEVFDSLNSTPSPRFMTLQKNYWAMVKSQVPMWEKDIGISPTNTAHSSQGAHSQRTPHEQAPRAKTPHGEPSPNKEPEKVQGITPRKHRSKKQHQKQMTST